MVEKYFPKKFLTASVFLSGGLGRTFHKRHSLLPKERLEGFWGSLEGNVREGVGMGARPVTRLLGSLSLGSFLLLSSCMGGGGGGSGGGSLPSTTYTPPSSSNTSVVATKGTDIAVDPSNNVWVVVTDGVMEIPEGTTSCATTTDCPIITVGFTPAGIAADKNGSIWVTDDTSSGSVTEIKTNATSDCSSSCTTFSGSNYFSSPVGIAADGSGNIWVTNDTSSGSVTEIKSGSTCCTTFSGSTYFSSPVGIAADGSGNIWVTNDTSSGSVTEITSTATSCSSTTCPNYGGFSSPVAVAVSPSGGVPWVANSSSGTYTPGVVAMNTTYCTSSGNCPEITGFTKPVGLAFDSSSNLWVIDAGTSQAIEITASAISAESCKNDPCYQYSLSATPQGIATDSLGNVWITLNNGEIVKYTP